MQSSERKKIFTDNHNLFSTFADKISYLSQTPCELCDIPYSRQIPIEITPWTHQSQRKNKQMVAAQIKVFIDARSDGDESYPLYPDESLCLKLLFVENSQFSKRSKDIDNLAKGILDALSCYVYKNDKQIVHINLLKMYAPNTNGYLKLSVGVTNIHKNKDIIDTSVHAKNLWMSKEALS